MSPPLADAHVTLYNKLPLISEAYDILRQELKAGPAVPLDKLMSPILQDLDIRTLLREGIPGENEGMLFSIWIVHRHFALGVGERMVSNSNDISSPSTNSTHGAAYWDASFNEIEFSQVGEDGTFGFSKAPSSQLATAFQVLVSRKFGVSGLGLCIAPTGSDGLAYIETTDGTTRSQITKTYSAYSLPPVPPAFILYPSSWSMTSDDDSEPTTYCLHPCK